VAGLADVSLLMLLHLRLYLSLQPGVIVVQSRRRRRRRR